MAIVFTPGTDLTVTSIDSLGSSATAVGSTNSHTISTDKNVTDVMIRVSITLGAHTPSATTLVNVFVYPSEDGTNWPGHSATTEVVTSAAEAITWDADGNQARWIGSMLASTASVTLEDTFYLSSACPSMPVAFKVVVQNQTGTAFAASGNTVAVTEISYS